MHWFRHQDHTVENCVLLKSNKSLNTLSFKEQSRDALKQYSFGDFPTDKRKTFAHLQEQEKLKDSCSSKRISKITFHRPRHLRLLYCTDPHQTKRDAFTLLFIQHEDIAYCLDSDLKDLTSIVGDIHIYKYLQYNVKNQSLV